MKEKKGLDVTGAQGGVLFRVKALPNSQRTEAAGLYGGAVKIRVNAAPEKGKANREIESFLSGLLGLKKREVEVIKGLSSRDKTVKASGISETGLIKILTEAAADENG